LTSEVRPSAEAGTVTFDPHNCFACGSLNTNGLQLDLHFEADRCWTELAIPERFQGWDEIAHGGIVSTILDEVMAWSLVDRDNWGLTARLNVQFRRPVPLGRRIRAEGRITNTRRRLIDTAATIVDAGTGDLLATADGTYVAAPDDRKRELKARYGFRRVPAAAAAPAATAGPTR
jgi:acyl-coenzyme A thioesterase PaaI-like protein